MADPELILDEDFETPAVRARLDVLLLLAWSVRLHLKELFEATEADSGGPGWDEVIAVLAQTFAQQIKSLSEVKQVTLLWNRFLNDNHVAGLGAGASAVLTKMFNQLQSLIQNPQQSVDYLVQANLDAARAAGDLAKQKGLTRVRRSVGPVPVLADYDDQATQYCASAARTAGHIRWGLQLVEHAFYGALIAPLVFYHEYLSHLLPRSMYLSKTVREVWLVVALDEEHRNSDVPGRERIIDQFLWQKFRYELAAYYDASDIDLLGPLNVDALARKMHFAFPEAFWKLTRMMMTVENMRRSQAAHDILVNLAGLSDELLRGMIAKIMTEK